MTEVVIRVVNNWQSIGINQGPGDGTNYPFVAPSADILYLLGDLFLSYNDHPATPAVFPFHVTWMAGFGTHSVSNPTSHTQTHTYDMVIADANGQVIFDSTAASGFLATPWGNHLVSIQWINGSNVLRCTLHTAPPPQAPSFVADTFIVPANGQLDSRTIYRMPKHVTSIKVGSSVLTGAVALAQGYNVSFLPVIDSTKDGGRLSHAVSLRARPGDGLGRSPGCNDAQPILRRINGVVPDAAGNLIIDMSGCYRIQRPMHAIQASPLIMHVDQVNALSMYNDCGPCCTCDDFVRTYKGVYHAHQRLEAVGLSAEASRNTMLKDIARWKAQAACRAAVPLRITTLMDPDCCLFVGVSYCNMTLGCITPLTIRLTFQATRSSSPYTYSPSNVTPRCRDAFYKGTDTNLSETLYVPTGPFPVFDTLYSETDPQSTDSLRVRYQFAGCSDTDVITVTATVHAANPVNPITGQVYTLPTPSVPAGVTALWTGRTPAYPACAIIQQSVALTTSLTPGC